MSSRGVTRTEYEMSKQSDKDIALIGRSGHSLYSYRDGVGVWQVRASGKYSPSASALDYDEALHGVATALHDRLRKANEATMEKAAKQCAENQTIIGDWTEDS